MQTFFQSTLLREERLNEAFNSLGYISFSIHAPTRGATKVMMATLKLQQFSIHAPTRGATYAPISSLTIPLLFQSTLLREERPDKILELECWRNFSIHAPTRGATKDSDHVLDVTIFQSTLLREERPTGTDIIIEYTTVFNPRSYARSDQEGQHLTMI